MLRISESLNITMLVPVWGERYISKWLELSLPSLLAEGNIPALAGSSRLTCLILTCRADEQYFSRHPHFSKLTNHCRVEFIAIDDLIFPHRYAATLTMAYERGMRRAGALLCETYFIYLVADYVMASGSLANLLPYMREGVSGITAGNFQVIEEEVEAHLRAQVNRDAHTLTLLPRELMACSLPHLHPIAKANIVNAGNTRTSHTNRLFWQVDEHTLIGHFYLKHMLVIRPEIDHYIIGASCDYAFIPEMCPSGNIVHLGDSDEYCVIEMQPRDHEKKLIQQGGLTQDCLTKSLGEWTNATHRHNSLHPIIFHSHDIPDNTSDWLSKSQQMIEKINADLPAVQPTRGHPYWVSCVDAVLERLILNDREVLSARLRDGVVAGVIGSPVFEPPMGEGGDYLLLKLTRFRHETRWDFHAILALRRFILNLAHAPICHPFYHRSRSIRQSLPRCDRPTLLISDKPNGFAEYCRLPYTHYQQIDVFLARDIPFMPEDTQAIILAEDEHKLSAAKVRIPNAYCRSTQLTDSLLTRLYQSQVKKIFQPQAEIRSLPRLMAVLIFILVCGAVAAHNVIISWRKYHARTRY